MFGHESGCVCAMHHGCAVSCRFDDVVQGLLWSSSTSIVVQWACSLICSASWAGPLFTACVAITDCWPGESMKDIPKDEEITFDYSTTQTGGFWSMLCQCGSSHCRGMIGDFRDLPTSTKTFYVEEGAVLTYLLAELGVEPSKVSRDSYKSGRRSRKKPIPARNC